MKHEGSEYELFEMDKRRMKNSTLAKGTITYIDRDMHLASVEYDPSRPCPGFPTENVPFYYYCQDGSTEKGDTAFIIDDEVEVIRLRYLDENHPDFNSEDDEYYIMGHADRWDVVACKGDTIVIRAFGSSPIGIDQRVSGGSWITIIDAISGRKRTDLGFDFPCRSDDPDFLLWSNNIEVYEAPPFWTYYNYWYDAAYDPTMIGVGGWSVGYVGIPSLQEADVSWPSRVDSWWGEGEYEVFEILIDNAPAGYSANDYILWGGYVNHWTYTDESPSVYGGSNDDFPVFCCGLYPLGSDEIVATIEGNHTYSKHIVRTKDRMELTVHPPGTTHLLYGNEKTVTNKEAYYSYSGATYSHDLYSSKVIAMYDDAIGTPYFLRHELTINQIYTVERDDIGDYATEVIGSIAVGYPSGYWQTTSTVNEDELVTRAPYSEVPFIHETFSSEESTTITYPRVGDITWEMVIDGLSFSNADTYQGTYGSIPVFLSSSTFSVGEKSAYCISAIAVRNRTCIRGEGSGTYPVNVEDADIILDYEDITVFADMGVAEIPEGGKENITIGDFSRRANSANLSAAIKELLVLQQSDIISGISPEDWADMTFNEKKTLMVTIRYLDAFPVLVLED